ncbi:MAG: hypothetical protein C0625_16005 [Arcobacter sp.]|nr:MAG: hypothetical protein C0625_16005 [Arcobacter sp.]
MRYLLIYLGLSFFSFLLASDSVGFIKKLKGEAIILRDTKIIQIKIGDKLFNKDIIKTKRNSSLGLIFKDNTLVSLGSNTQFNIEEYEFQPALKKEVFTARIVKGTMTCLTGLMSKLNPDAMKIKAKTASMGIRGTHFAISVE